MTDINADKPVSNSSHLIPQTLWEKLYLGWFLICFLMVWIGTWAVNKPIAVLGMPLVYVWCTSWGIVWLAGCWSFGTKIAADDAAIKGE
tara:strand:- start:970 stop:1236 length:267 start_codon:yes stop_codon:yes gene_type:complete